MIKIEKNIPLARQTHLKPPASIYPFKEMEAGDSFAMTVTPDQLIKTRARVSVAAHAHGNANERKFAIRTLSPTTFRVWRTV